MLFFPRLTNFRLLHDVKAPSSMEEMMKVKDDVFLAEIDVTSGIWPFRRTKTVQIAKAAVGTYWFFVDTGGFTPGRQAEDLAKVYKVQEMLRSKPTAVASSVTWMTKR